MRIAQGPGGARTRNLSRPPHADHCASCSRTGGILTNRQTRCSWLQVHTLLASESRRGRCMARCRRSGGSNGRIGQVRPPSTTCRVPFTRRSGADAGAHRLRGRGNSLVLGRPESRRQHLRLRHWVHAESGSGAMTMSRLPSGQDTWRASRWRAPRRATPSRSAAAAAPMARAPDSREWLRALPEPVRWRRELSWVDLFCRADSARL